MASAATSAASRSALPEATEGAHMGHPDFRVRNKIFASLGVPDKAWGMVKLTPEQQEMLMRPSRACSSRPPAPGAAAATRTCAWRPWITPPAKRTRHGLAQHGAEDPRQGASVMA